MKLAKLTASTMAALALTATAGVATAEVNVYSYRQDFLIKPMLDEFTKETGIKVNAIYVKDGIAEKLKQEGKHTPADVVLTVDISRLEQLVKEDLTQPIKSSVVDANIPKNLHGKHWVALTQRARAIYTSKERVGHLPYGFTYLDLAKPEFKGKVCIREGKHPYNVSLVASIIEHHGKKTAKKFLEGLKSNLARKPQGGDRDQVKAIMEGVCDYALGNSYYYGVMLTNQKQPQQQKWAEAVYINFPNQADEGAHMNVSGVVLTKYAPHKKDAMKLIEFLTGDKAQQMYAEVNFEYPVKPGVKTSALVDSWGSFKKDDVDVTEIADHYKQALKLIDEVKFDLK